MSKCYILVGVPGSGKSTWVDNYSDPEGKWVHVASTDNIISYVADQYGRTYDWGFKNLIKFAEQVMWDDLFFSANEGDTIIIDRTNLTPTSRARFINFLKPYGYEFEAIVFSTPDDEEWKRRLDRPGKTIPSDVLESMSANMAYPTEDEGFSTISEYF